MKESGWPLKFEVDVRKQNPNSSASPKNPLPEMTHKNPLSSHCSKPTQNSEFKPSSNPFTEEEPKPRDKLTISPAVLCQRSPRLCHWYPGVYWHWIFRNSVSQLTSCWQLETSHGENIEITEISKCYKSGLTLRALVGKS